MLCFWRVGRRLPARRRKEFVAGEPGIAESVCPFRKGSSMNIVLDISHKKVGRKSDLVYTEEYFDALRQIVDRRPHRCAGCRVTDGSKEGKDGSLKKFPAVVRLCLIDPTSSANDARNVDMFCTRCRKAPLEWRTPRCMKPGQLQQLFAPQMAIKPPKRLAA
jgi:hypothetical protein